MTGLAEAWRYSFAVAVRNAEALSAHIVSRMSRLHSLIAWHTGMLRRCSPSEEGVSCMRVRRVLAGTCLASVHSSGQELAAACKQEREAEQA